MKDENIITITLDDGEEMDFVEIAYFPYQGQNYSLLQPPFGSDEESEKCVYIFRVIQEDEEESYILIEGKEADTIFAEYERLLAKQLK